MGSRGASASTSTGRGGAVNLAGAERMASRAVDRFLADNDMMASDGELNGVYENTFVREATKLGASNLEINNALNKALRTDSVDYMAARMREAKPTSSPSRVIQVLNGKGDVVFEGVFKDYQNFVRRGNFKDDYSTRVARKGK